LRDFILLELVLVLVLVIVIGFCTNIKLAEQI
jgi:hypothetical protein